MDQRFFTNLSIEECRQRLSDLRPSPGFLEPLPAQTGEEGVFGGVQGEHIRLYARSVMALNSFRRIFYGRLEQVPGGTLISGEFRVPVWVRIFMTCWLAFVGFVLLLLIAAAVLGSVDWSFVAIPALMFFGGTVICFLGPWLGRAEEDDVASFICTHLEASKPAA